VVPSHFSIWIVSPPGYIHSRCFEELAIGLQAAFTALGYNVPIVVDPSQVHDTAIVLGANLLHGVPAPLPGKLILYNLEQIQKDSQWLTQDYISLLKRYPVWDYSALNIEKLAGHFGITKVALCGIGYMPELTRIAPAIQDIDVLFIGSINDRRRNVLEQLARHGKSVTAMYNSYGAERDAIIARAKIMLNLHFYDAQILEIVRLSYLLANRKCIVSETGFDATLEAPLKEGIAFASYGNLPDMCLRLLENTEERTDLAEKGFACFKALPQTSMLQRALATLT